MTTVQSPKTFKFVVSVTGLCISVACHFGLAAALFIIEAESPARGLVLNRSKSLIVAPPNHPVDHPLLSNIPVSFGGLLYLAPPSVLLNIV